MFGDTPRHVLPTYLSSQAVRKHVALDERVRTTFSNHRLRE